MKRTIALMISAIILIFGSTPLALANSNTDFNYTPFVEYQLLSTHAVTLGPSFNPLTFCARAGLVCYTPQFIRSAYASPSIFHDHLPTGWLPQYHIQP